MLVEITRIHRDGRHERISGNLDVGDAVFAQGDILFTLAGKTAPKGFVPTEFRKITVAHGESTHEHRLEVVDTDRSVALQWFHEATESPTVLTQFAYNQLQPGTRVLINVPEAETTLTHEEHDGYIIHTPAFYWAQRQFETRGARRENVYD